MLVTSVTPVTPNQPAIELEEAVLGQILMDPECLPLCRDLPVEAFSLLCHREIYKSMLEAEKKEWLPNLNTVCVMLKHAGKLAVVGGMSKLAQLCDRIVHSASIKQYAQMLIEQYREAQTTAKIKKVAQIVEKQGNVAAIAYLQGIMAELSNATSVEDVAFALTPKSPYEQVMRVIEMLKKESEEMPNGESRYEWQIGQIAKLTKQSKKDLMRIAELYLNSKKKIVVRDVVDFLAEGNDEREWVVGGYIPKGTTICMYAHGGTGKTLLAYDLALAVATGSHWNGYPTQKGKVVIVQTDEPEIDTRERLNIAKFGNLPRGEVSIINDWEFTRVDELKKIVENERPTLVIVDSFTSANRGSSEAEKDASYASKLYDLRDMANEYGCTFIVLHHENKGGGSRGSTAITDNVSEVWRLRKGTLTEQLKSTQRILDPEKTRSGFTTPIKLELNVENYSWKHLGEFGDGELGGKQPLSARLLQYLQNNRGVRFEPEELVHEFEGSSRDAIRMACERARKKGLLLAEERLKERETGQVRYKAYYAPLLPEVDEDEEEIDDEDDDTASSDMEYKDFTAAIPRDTSAQDFVKVDRSKEPAVKSIVTINAGSKVFDGKKAIVMGYVKEGDDILVHVKVQTDGAYNGYDLYYKSEFLQW